MTWFWLIISTTSKPKINYLVVTFILTSGFLLLQTGTPEQHSKLALQATIDYLAYGHTMLKTPVFVWSLKLINIGPCSYLVGWPPGNMWCRRHFNFYFYKLGLLNSIADRPELSSIADRDCQPLLWLGHQQMIRTRDPYEQLQNWSMSITLKLRLGRRSQYSTITPIGSQSRQTSQTLAHLFIINCLMGLDLKAPSTI